jgi:aspartate/methionine/tyrosine aminotransferase
MTFSTRTAWDLAENDLTAAVRAHRAAGLPLLDLTVSNPTHCGFHLDAPTLLAPLAQPAALDYTPDPFGLPSARQAVAAYYRDHAADIPPENLCLTTSTSEAYSFLFRLLCDPGDDVLVARPSYPLFDFIARLDGVHLREYPLFCDPGGDTHTWSIDLHALAAAIGPRTRAIILVHPNNPTGHFTTASEREALERLCATHNLALIVDEVFLDYALSPHPNKNPGTNLGAPHLASEMWAGQPVSFTTGPAPCLTFVLSGISKICALPQMKASWIAVRGPAALASEALARIEVIADTFLSMNAPIQHALPTWLAARHEIQSQILTRLRTNLATLDAALANTAAQRLATQAGWTTILRVPRTAEDFAHAALARNVLVQPGAFYGLPEGRAVLSLLTPPDIWRQGLTLLRDLFLA